MTLHKLLTLSIQYNRECLKLTQKYLNTIPRIVQCHDSCSDDDMHLTNNSWRITAAAANTPHFRIHLFHVIRFLPSPLPSILPSLHSPFIRMHLIKLLCRSQSSSEDYLNWSRVFQIFKIKFPDWAASFSAPYLFYQYSPVNFQQYLQIWGKLLWKENI